MLVWNQNVLKFCSLKGGPNESVENGSKERSYVFATDFIKVENKYYSIKFLT